MQINRKRVEKRAEKKRPIPPEFSNKLAALLHANEHFVLGRTPADELLEENDSKLVLFFLG